MYTRHQAEILMLKLPPDSTIPCLNTPNAPHTIGAITAVARHTVRNMYMFSVNLRSLASFLAHFLIPLQHFVGPRWLTACFKALITILIVPPLPSQKKFNVCVCSPSGGAMQLVQRLLWRWCSPTCLVRRIYTGKGGRESHACGNVNGCDSSLRLLGR